VRLRVFETVTARLKVNSKMVSRLAIVPARGGSKRIPDKNVRDFCGRPMVAHILSAISESSLFETVHVSTESPRIADIVAGLGFPTAFLRPEALADDHTPLMPVIRYVTERFRDAGKNFDEVWLLMACAPLIEASDLIGAAKMFSETGARSPVLSVAPYPAPIEWAYRFDDRRMLAPIQPDMIAKRSQDLLPAYHDTGSFCIFPSSIALEGSTDGKCLGYLLPRHKSVDIDDEDDILLAEAIFRSRKSSQ
jgi:pseudaminic acid cytidylyltransferase